VRLFVAINFPDDVRRGILRAAEPLRRLGLPVKWVDGAAIHLTLKFLGEVAVERSGDVTGAVDRAVARARAFLLPVGGFGAFPSAARARVVWVGCEAVPALELLQHDIEREFAALGFAVEGRPFRPHVTLGRARRERSAGVTGLAEPLARLVYHGEVDVRSVALMESVLSPAGARYTVRHAASLADGS
jgi:2'-5' RNA ligase